jgi:hypothetical protein
VLHFDVRNVSNIIKIVKLDVVKMAIPNLILSLSLGNLIVLLFFDVIDLSAI